MKDKNKIQSNLVPAYKPLGISPYDLIKALKYDFPELREQKIAYAGRLDPMARGVVLLIWGDKLEDFDDHLTVDKSYRAKVLYGFSTDTYDLLGLAEEDDNIPVRKEIIHNLRDFEGKISLPFPPYSSYKLKGKPLFEWAREGKLDQIEIPNFQAEVFNLEVVDIDQKPVANIKKPILKKLSRVVGDFRQEKIIRRWNKLLDMTSKTCLIADIEINCSSGCYVRSIAHHSGKQLTTKGLLYDLTRLKVGKWDLKSCLSY